MLRSFLVARSLVATAVLVASGVLVACSGGTGDAGSYYDERAEPGDEGALPTPGDSATDVEMPEVVDAPADATADVVDEDPNVDVSGIDGMDADVTLPTNGLQVGGTCFAVCALGDATDADESGTLDGWGWENEESCLVDGSNPAAQATPCARASSTPLLGPPALPGSAANRPEGVDSIGFFVSGGRLFDALGNDFVMRGVNNPLAWFRNRNTGALAWLSQIAATGANSVRLVWERNVGDVSLLREALQRSIELNMVPMVEMHDVTGGRDVDEPAQMARYYSETPAVRQLLIDYEAYLLVNLANEWDGGDDIYVEAYTRAIEVMRNAGLNHTLVIDANGYGQNADMLIREGQNLLAIDPQHNLLFSSHFYQNFRDPQTVTSTLDRMASAQVPFIVGEFGFQHGEDRQGNPIPVAFETLLSEAERHGFGYLAWSWTGNSRDVSYLDLTARSGSVNELSSWGDDIVNGPFGIRETSRMASVFE